MPKTTAASASSSKSVAKGVAYNMAKLRAAGQSNPRRSTPSSSASSSRDAGFVFKLHKARFQKGAKKDSLSGNVWLRLRLKYAYNEAMKKKLTDENLTLGEFIRWLPDEKVHTFKVNTKVQAEKILTALKDISPEVREALPKEVEDDDFAEARACAVSIVPVSDSELMLDGFTYPLREDLKKLGFEYKIDFVPGVDRWVGPSSKIDTAEVTELFEEWGWTVTVCTHVTDDE